MRSFGPITYAAERVFNGFRRASLANILFGITAEQRGLFRGPTDNDQFDVWRSARVDVYVLAWLAVELAFAFLAPSATGSLLWFILVALAYRVIDITQAAVNMTVFAHLRRPRGQYNITSATRALLLTLWTYGELALCFAIFYSSSAASLTGMATWWDPYYFSAITQLTVGYGDITPLGPTRILVPLQALLGLLLALVAIARIVGFMPRPRSVLGDDE